MQIFNAAAAENKRLIVGLLIEVPFHEAFGRISLFAQLRLIAKRQIMFDDRRL